MAGIPVGEHVRSFGQQPNAEHLDFRYVGFDS